MAINIRTQALKRLRKKLDALRVTLPDDEREIFDRLIAKDEVEAHRVKGRIRAKGARPPTRPAPEVEAHALTQKARAKAYGKARSKARAKQADK